MTQPSWGLPEDPYAPPPDPARSGEGVPGVTPPPPDTPASWSAPPPQPHPAAGRPPAGPPPAAGHGYPPATGEPGWSAAGAAGPGGAPGLDGVSVAALVCAVLAWPVGLVLGVVGVFRTRGGARRGRGLAVAAVVVAPLVGLLNALAVGALLLLSSEEGALGELWPVDGAAGEQAGGADSAGEAGTAEAPAEEDPVGGSRESDGTGAVGPEDLRPGDCVLEPEADEFQEVEVVDCGEPHDYEVVAVAELEGASWPGDTEIWSLANDACLAESGDLLTSDAAERLGLTLEVFVPTEKSWRLGDRDVSCLVYSLDGQLTEPVAP